MYTQIKNSLLFFTFTLFLCFNSFFLMNAAAQGGSPSVSDNYTFETINVPDVDFLAVTASSDFEGYAGYTKSADGEKEIAFTLIDGVLKTYDFPGSQNTYFFALGNNGNAAGHYEDTDGLYHGIILENGQLREYNFPDSVETQIYGISDATGALTGNFIDASGIRRGFSGEIIVEFPGAPETFADFVNASGRMVGSYIDTDGIYHAYVRSLKGKFTSIKLPTVEKLEYYFIHGISDADTIVARSKAVDDVPRTYVGKFGVLQELRFPGSVSTEGYNINQDGSVVGYYDTADGRRHGFIARPIADEAPLVAQPPTHTYTFESIDVPGIDFLAVTASSDFEDYAGYTKSADGEKEVAFTLIDDVFMTYDFPGSQKTHFYALGNNGQAAGHYQDSDGLYHGVILENGELRQYNFPNAVETEIYGISDATGALTGNFTDISGIRRGFTGDEIIEAPGASETFADFVNADGVVVGSYVDPEGAYFPYVRSPDGNFTSITDFPNAEKIEYAFLSSINDAWTFVFRFKLVGSVPGTSVGTPRTGVKPLQVPGSVSTEGWNINQDGSVVGHYDSADGRRHGFIARPVDETESNHFGNFYTVMLSKGLNMLSVPLAPPTPMNAKSLVAMTGATTIIMLDVPNQRFVAWTPEAPNDGFAIEGGQGYIVNVPETRNFAFVGAPWRDETQVPAAPSASQQAWAFVVSGRLAGEPTFDGYQVIVRNLRTNSTVTAAVEGDYFAAATADLSRRSVVQVGDVVELRVIGPGGNAESQTLTFKVTPEHLANAVLSVRFDSIGQPMQNLLLQNYPNPFNPETWIPYQLSEDSAVSVSIYDTTGQLVRTLPLGFQSAGFYNSRERAAYWNGRNALGERVASGIYFYQLTTPSFQQTRRLVIIK
ncbi:MAG: T9SS type A sorting domain-containing protein [Candidatus Poribacteria bacterium]|nr:T9SS type A sorting domain-containing protein [Candidatus Poribacteria bacterium]